MDNYALFDGNRTVKTGDSLDGLKLTALFHVNNGDQIIWALRRDITFQRRKVFEQGFVNGKPRFYVTERKKHAEA